MALSTHTTTSGFILPSIHSAPPFFTEQPHPNTRSIATEQWIRLILSYARHKKLFVLKVEDADDADSDWAEILRNERINPTMVGKGQAAYEPPKQTRSCLVHWRLPEEWAEVLYDWVISTGQLNVILTFLDITEPEIESALSGIPIPLLRKAIAILGKTGRSQMIVIGDGEGVRFLPRAK
ncbi:hypothetical protein CVT24_007042 [Panaeolus cyanescens]|uniref:ESCRT-II complex subunit VPS25 n=1 Tax=Panaeolus cyanescens TaxID=181874 RepID=A0A409VJP3_9AGAR|nr:hypothetical protein CVT24_007042 [Panaeolus cyanescens]